MLGSSESVVPQVRTFPNLSGQLLPDTFHPTRNATVTLSHAFTQDADIHEPALQVAWAKLLTLYLGETEVALGASDGSVVTVDLAAFETTRDVVEAMPGLIGKDASILAETVVCLQRSSADPRLIFPETFLAAIVSRNKESGEWAAELEYDSNLIPQLQASRILEQFSHLYRAVNAFPNQHPTDIANTFPTAETSISQPGFSLLDATETHFLHSFFSNAAETHPDNIALEFVTSTAPYQAEKVTYAQLDAETNQLANYLQIKQCVRPDDVIALCMDKSVHMYRSILGVMKAGAAYCPVDAYTPLDRFEYILQQTGARVILVAGKGHALADQIKALKTMKDVQIIAVDSDDSPVKMTPFSHPPSNPSLSPHHLAYVLYTSGTTGKPKGVMIHHSAAVQSILAHTALLPTPPGTRFLQFAATTFDVSIFDMHFTWNMGFTLVSASQELMLRDLGGLIAASETTYLDLTPTVAGTLKRDLVPSIKVVICIGEALTQKVVDEFGGEDVETDCLLINLYGPTEAAIAVTGMTIKRSERTIPAIIGGPFSTVTTMILASPTSSVPVPMGCLGELCLSGPQLARGYLGRPDLTAEKFAELTTPQINARIYRTGDLVRQLATGHIEYLGRMDDQVKLNGYRIELDEVNAVLATPENGITQALTLILRHESWQRDQMVSFVATQSIEDQRADCFLVVDGTDATRDVVRQAGDAARKALPPYMVPQVILAINRIPLGTAGKVDRNRVKGLFAALTGEQLLALLLASASSSQTDSSEDSEWTPVELKIRAAIADQAGLDPTSITKQTTIFHLGIDSIGAMKLLATLRTNHGIQISVLDVMQYPSIAGMSSRVSGVDSESSGDLEKFKKEDEALLQDFDARNRETVVAALEDKSLAASIARILPATPLQEGLLVETLKLPGTYITHETFGLHQNTDSDRLHSAICRVVERTDVLRTTFCAVEDPGATFAQVVYVPERLPRWRVCTVQSDDQVETVLETERAYRTAVNVDFPMIDLVLVKGPTLQKLHMRIHHALYDGWALAMILQDVLAAYRDETLPPRSQFQSALVQFLPDVMASRGGDGGKTFWMDALKEFTPVPFPDFSNTSLKPTGIHATWRTSAMSLTDMNALAKASGVSLRAAGQAAWAILLSTYLDSPDICFGHVLSGRTSDDDRLSSIIGPFFNILPTRVTLSSHPTTLDLINYLQSDYVAMLPFQHIHLRTIRGWLGQSHTSANPLFDTMFVLQQFEGSEGMDDNEIWTREYSMDVDEFPVSMEMYPIPESGLVKFKLCVKDAVMSTPQTELFVRQFDAVLEGVLREAALAPGQGAAKWVNDVEKSYWPLVGLPDDAQTGAEFFYDYVRIQAARTPDAAAVTFVADIEVASETLVSTSYTYSQLATLATQFAHFLRGTYGVSKGDRVIICTPKSKEWVVAVLGVVMAGAVYVPLDHAAPAERKKFLSEDVVPKVVISLEELKSGWDEQAPICCLDSEDVVQAWKNQSTEEVDPGLTGDDVAYILYTSGTTGRPKGVLVTHANITASIDAQRHLIPATSDSKYLHFAAASFDVHIYEMLYPFSTGMELFLTTKDLLLKDLELVFRSCGITHSELTPSVVGLLTPASVPALRHLSMGGEAMTPAIIETWCPTTTLYNSYGPTEVTITCTLLAGVTRGTRAANIGWCLENVTGYVLTRDGTEVVPKGAVGELCVGGPLVAAGYLNQPSLTASKFIDFEFAGVKDRIYRTGDLVRMMADGSFEFLGRADDQVKMNGIRIELAEITSVLTTTCGQTVDRAATVLVQHPERGAKELVSFVVLKDCGLPTGGEVQVLTDPELHTRIQMDVVPVMRQNLPIYMLPTFILPIPHIPLGGTGKTDLKSLISAYTSLPLTTLLSFSASSQSTDAKVEWTELEQKIAAVLADLSGIDIERILPTTTIFELGIDSLRAIALVNRLGKVGVRTSVSEVMTRPCARELAGAIEKRSERTQTDQDQVKQKADAELRDRALLKSFLEAHDEITAPDVEAVYPCLPLQEGLITETLRETHPVNINSIIYTLAPETETNKLKDAWNTVVGAVDLLRTVFFVSDGGMGQAVLKDCECAAEAVECADEAAYHSLLAKQKMAVFDLVQEGRRPPVQCTIVTRTYNNSRVIVWTLHHALYDGWSIQLLLDAVQQAYHGTLDTTSLPKFKDFVSAVGEQDPEAAKQFWTETLKDVGGASFPELTGLHRDETVPIVSKGIEHIATLPLSSVESAAKALGATVQVLGQVAWGKLLGLYLNEPDVVFGHVVSGRTVAIPNVERLAAPCFNTIPCRVHLEAKMSIRDVVAQVQRKSAGALAYQHTSLRHIQQWMDRSMPLFDTLFIYQKTDLTESDQPQLWTGEEEAAAEIDYPVTLELEPRPDTDSLVVSLGYWTHVLPESHAGILVKQFEKVLGDIVRDVLPDTKVASVDEEQVMAVQKLRWADQDLTRDIIVKKSKPSFLKRMLGSSGSPKDVVLLHHFIEDQAAFNPYGVALEYLTRSLQLHNVQTVTFNGLNKRANRLARHLVSQGVTPTSRVVISMARSVWMYVAILAVLKCGATYVPVDPQAPEKRKAFIAEDVEAVAVLTTSDCELDIETLGCVCIAVDKIPTATLQQLPKHNLDIEVKSSDLAYMIYTSGTTGTPKGVMTEHYNAVTAIKLYQNILPAKKNRSRLLQFASAAFDVSVLDIFWGWAVGITLVAVEKDLLLSNVPGAMSLMRITHATLTPTVASLIHPSTVPTLECLISGGEAITRKVLQAWSGKVFNAYGPTEATIGCTIQKNVTPRTRTTNIGPIFDSCSAYVVDQNMTVLPRGAVGELCIGGPHVARGYLNRTELTAEKFVDLNGERVYRSGDFVRMLADGTIEYVGRQDDQVKYNGLRIELGEISAALLQSAESLHDAVTLVLKHPDLPKDQLVSFVTKSGDKENGASTTLGKEDVAVVEFLASSAFLKKVLEGAAERIPNYMVPGQVLLINTMPLGNSSKADTKALSQLFASLDANALTNWTSQENDRPWTAVARELRRVLAIVSGLPLSSISQSSTIFQLGIDSVNAIRIVRELKNVGLYLTVSDVMKYPTIQLMSTRVKGELQGVESRTAQERIELIEAFDTKYRNDLVGDDAKVDAIYPCTPLQEAMLVETLKSDTRPYVSHIPFEIKSGVDVDRLLAAWNTVIRQNDILRTGFKSAQDGHGYVQVVHRDYLSDITRFEIKECTLDQLMDAQTKAIVDAVETTGLPPLTITVLQDNGVVAVVLLSIHHALYDGWSLPLLLEDVAKVYENVKVLDRPQFRDFVGYIMQQEPQEAESYWTRLLTECTPSMFPANLHGYKVDKTEIQSATLKELTSECTLEMLQEASQALNVSLQALGQAAWSLLLSMYSGETNVMFGHVVSGRSVAVEGVTDMMGPTFNTIPVRVDLTPSLTLGDLVKSVHAMNVESLSYQHTPLRTITKCAKASEHGVALFDTIFLYQKLDDSDEDQQAKLWTVDEGRAGVNYAVSVEMEPHMNKVILRVAVQDAIMPANHVELLLKQMDALLRELVTNHSATIDKFDMPNGADWAAYTPVKRHAPNENLCLHDWVAEYARKTPAKHALEFYPEIDATQRDVLTYAQLDSQASNLAQHLIQQGVKPGSYVPICSDKSLSMYIAVVAVLKAGAAFVPITPDIPDERKLFILEDVKANVLLVGNVDLIAPLSERLSGVTTVVIDQKLIHSLSDIKIELPTTSAKSAAYVIYTSGTTGVPKGVVVPHEGARDALDSLRETVPMSENTRMLQFASFIFDVCVFELFISWSVGSTVVTAPRDALLIDLENALRVLNVSHADLTPAIAKIVKPENVPLEVLVTGGEALTQQVLDNWAETRVLVNAYGPTEASIGCTIKRVERKTHTSNIGPAFTTCSAYVLRGMQVQPIGAIGELCVGGTQVAIEYVNRPDLTAEKFVIFPATGERLYRTGDFVRMLADGSIEFQGRQDEQVKLNGLRIELAEIDTVIVNADNSIADAVTMVLKHPDHDLRQLVSFVSLRDSESSRDADVALVAGLAEAPVLKTVQREAQNRLPAYMVPALIFFVNRIPLGRTGKADRKALAELYSTIDRTALIGAEIEGDGDLEWTALERTIRECFGQAANVEAESVKRNTSIFQLGLDSISAIQLCARLKQHDCLVAVSEIMKYPTVARLSNFLQSKREVTTSDVQAIQPFDLSAFEKQVKESLLSRIGLMEDQVQHIYPSTPLQEGMIVESLRSEGKYYYNHVAFKLAASVDVPRLLQAWNDVVAANDALRTSFHALDEGNYGYAQVVQKTIHLPITFETVAQSADLQAAFELHTEQARYTLDLGKPPISLRVIAAPEERWLCLSLHHALYDGWSLPLIMDDVLECYLKATPPTARPQYRELVQYVLTHNEEEAKTYWSKELDKYQPTSFPTNLHGKRVPDTGKSIGLEHHMKVLVADVEKAASMLDCSLQAFAQASWAVLLASYTGEADVVFGRVISGRTVPVENVQAIIGPSFNTVPCRVTLTDKSAKEIVRNIHHANVESINYQQTPLTSIMRWTESQRSGQPLFNTLFLYQMQEKESGTSGEEAIWTTADGEADINYDVTLEVEAVGDHFCVRAACQTFVMPTAHLQVLLEQFETVLRQIVTFPDRNPAVVDLVDNRVMSVQDQLFLTSSENVEFLHRGIEKNAVIRPNEPALIVATEVTDTVLPENLVTYSYYELNYKANQIAWFLKERNIGENDLVPLCLDRSAWTYMTILGVLKASGAYVPIDPEAPVDRKKFIIAETECKFVLTTSKNKASLAEIGDVEVICLDEIALRDYPGHNLPQADLKPSSFAYVIYTSGTTGTPKGVLIEHSSAGAAMETFKALLPMVKATNPRLMQFASYTFDVSVYEMFFTWQSGYALATCSKDLMLSNLEVFIREVQITHCNMTPTIAALVKRENIPDLEVLIFGGEALTQPVLDAWAGKGVTLINAYGPTEATIGCTMYVDVQKETARNNIGLAWPTCSLYVVSEKGDLLPRGAVGELCVGGPQVARGYLKRPELTAEKFVTFPWLTDPTLSAQDQPRVYRTGDLARLLADGCVEFLGRIDDQVKINGLRIELGEISSTVARAHPLMIVDAVTIVSRHSKQQRDQLVTFMHVNEMLVPETAVQATQAQLLNPADWSTELNELVGYCHQRSKAHMPAYMLPAFIIPVNRMPKGQTNKTSTRDLDGLFKNLDFEVLQALALETNSEGNATPDDPNREWTRLEQDIRNVVASVAALDPHDIGARASIYQLGLDSISAIRVSSKLRGIGIHISVGEILRARTIEKMAVLLEGENRVVKSVLDSREVVATPAATDAYLMEVVGKDFVTQSVPSFVQNAAIERILPVNASQIFTLSSWISSRGQYFNPTFLFQSNAPIDVKKLETSWAQLCQHHEILRTVFFATSSVEMPFVQVILEKAVPVFTHEVIKGVYHWDTLAPIFAAERETFNSVASPPSRMRCLTFNDCSILLLTMNHALYDGWSVPLLLSDLSELYVSGTAPAITLSWSSFMDNIVADRSRTDFTRLKSEWKTVTDANNDFLFPHLNTDHPTSQNTVDTRFDLPNVIPKEALDALMQKCQQKGLSFQSYVLAAWAKTQESYTVSSNHVAFGLYHANRSHPEGVDTLRGPTVNVLPLQSATPSTKSIFALASELQEELSHQVDEMPYVTLHDIQTWCGRVSYPLINVFINFLITETAPAVAETAMLKPVPLDVLPPTSTPEPTASRALGLENSKASPIQSDVDLEVAVRDGGLCLAIFSPAHVLSVSQGEQVLRRFVSVLTEECI
ncbi:hypothetical protein DFS34DRAFT_417935 [Phlyctochytrium arcticum]|nr:hypothetical protein DFS34DRAFT_417935 [Phlyctochytrium arcticum]